MAASIPAFSFRFGREETVFGNGNGGRCRVHVDVLIGAIFFCSRFEVLR